MCTKNYLLVLLLTCCWPFALQAQYENVWVFGHLITNGTGDKIDFNGAVPITAPITYSSPGEGTASVSGQDGQLLFYTEGDTVWNKNGIIMPNGQGLTGLPTTPWGYNTTNGTNQGSMIVPMPAHPGKYFVFSLTDQSYGTYLGYTGYLYYSVVDMALDGGNGDVDTTQKGVLVDSLLTEAMSGVAGNNCNIWITVGGLNEAGQASVFKSYELTSAGCNMTPVVSTVAGPPLISGSGYESLVRIGFSPDRSKMLRSRLGHPNGLELFDFNPATGLVCNLMSIDSGSNTGYYGACFSPDNLILYASEYGKGIYQFDLNNSNAAAIYASKLLVDSTGGNSEIKSAPDGKLYFSPFVSGQTVYYLSCINNPNIWGAACMPGISPITLPNPSNRYFNFPNVVPITIRDTIYQATNLSLCSQSDSLVRINDTTTMSFLWNDGSTDSVLKIAQSGTYWVKYSNYCHYITDTIVVTIKALAPVIVYNSFYLSTTIPYNTYQWYKDGLLIPGATNNTYNYSEDGDYSVAVSDGTCADTSAVLTIANGTGIYDYNALAENINIYPNPASDIIYIDAPVTVAATITSIEGKFIKQAMHTKQISIKELPLGIYFLHILDKDGHLLKVNKFVKSK